MSRSSEDQNAQQTIERLRRRLKRAELAREEAEQILERRGRELIKANEQLMERESQLRERLDRESLYLLRAQRTARIASFHRDRGKALSTSPEFYRLLGLAPGVKVDESAMLERIHPLDRDRVKKLEAAFYETGEPGKDLTYEFRIRRDGDVRWLRWVIRRENDEHEGFQSLLGTVQDITEQRAADRKARALALIADRRVKQLVRLSEELEVSRYAAEEAYLARTRFLSAMSHDVRTPMNGLMGMLDLLSLEEVDHEQADRLRIAKRSAEELQRHIEDIVEMANAEDEGEGLESSAQSVDIERFFSTLFSFWGHFAGRADSRPVLTIDADVPSRLYLYPVRLKQILDAQIGRLSQGHARVDAQVFRDGGALVTRLSCDIDAGPLTALGYYRDRWLRRIADSIEAVIEPWQDSTNSGIELRIPLEEPRGDVQGARSKDGVAEEGAERQACRVHEGYPPSVLVVDDIETNRIVLLKMLEYLGCRVDLASDGDEAIERVTQANHDLVFMDIQMARMSGLEATRQIRQFRRFAGLPIIAVTAYANRKELASFMEQGFTGALTKPLKRQVLVEMLERHIPRFLSSTPSADASIETSSAGDREASDRTALDADQKGGPVSGHAMASEVDDQESTLLDEGHFRAIFESLPLNRRKMLLDAAVDDIERLTCQLTSAYWADDDETVRQVTHSLKGVAGNLGSGSLLACIERFRESRPPQADIFLEQISHQGARVIARSRALFEGINTGI
ncbi:response regulator [Modicisalibacter radicis]|uniref:response regulator n=1 Tax=Halomonas sp. EAR18 TaxID=2518972 RepID=UPI00109C0ADF|nr:response regulator [Halomonas sp. EAR18]